MRVPATGLHRIVCAPAVCSTFSSTKQMVRDSPVKWEGSAMRRIRWIGVLFTASAITLFRAAFRALWDRVRIPADNARHRRPIR